jgi:hypothetical protein
MHRYLPGILIVQIVTLSIFWVSLDASLVDSPKTLLLQAGVPALLIALVTALWFASIARADAERMTAKLRVNHARDREKLQVNAERTKAKLREQAHKEIRKQERRVSRRANFKVGLAFTAATVAGVLMLLTEMLTLGLMTITTAGGAMGGYLLRWRQARSDTVNPAAPEAGGEPMPRIPFTIAGQVEAEGENVTGTLPVLEEEKMRKTLE